MVLHLHAVLHLDHSECKCCPAATPRVILSARQPVSAHFASLWLTLMALHSVQPTWSSPAPSFCATTCTQASCRPRAPAWCATAFPLSALHSLTLSVQPTNTQLKAHIPNHVSSTEFSCLHAVVHLGHSECKCCPAATPQVIVTHSLSETTRVHSFASLWRTLTALHSLQLNFSLAPAFYMQQPAPATFRSVCRSHSSCPLCSIHWYPLSRQQKQCHSEPG